MIEALRQAPVAARRVELVERKGLGHPDTICDSLVEAIAVALNRLYRERAGTILHYNIDKALLVAGQCVKGFGGGEVRRPMTLIVGDRATLEVGGVALPVEDTLREAVDAWVAAHLPRVRPGKDLVVQSALAAGSAELRAIVQASGGLVGSNDTSGASGWAPLSPTERIVLDVEQCLNGAEFKGRFPDTGQDVKVFGVREDERLAVTIAMPLFCADTASEAAYFGRKDEILSALAARFRDAPLALEWRLNNLDARGRGADGTYLTVTGTSAEDADSGQVGRGNRVGGLIAHARPTSGEAAAGKNAVAHAGKVYGVLSHYLAGRVHARCPALPEVYVHLMARIGEPVDRPWAAVQVILPREMALADVEPAIREVMEAEIAGLPAFRDGLLRGEHRVC
ncbi:MAG: methionine adenosyltransferase [Candidatus Rokubacteria bacterium]|nr:methionine adenosyltransferase [Candidatus Rokubacteria bacterium]